MARTKETLDKLIVFIEDILENEFDTKSGREYIVFNDKTYTRGDFRLMIKAVERTRAIYTQGVNKSSRYLKKNAEYNRTLRLISYYKHKKNKTISDFEKLEELQKHLQVVKEERIKTQREDLDELERQRQRELEYYMKKERDLSDEL